MSSALPKPTADALDTLRTVSDNVRGKADLARKTYDGFVEGSMGWIVDKLPVIGPLIETVSLLVDGLDAVVDAIDGVIDTLDGKTPSLPQAAVGPTGAEAVK